MFKKLLQISVFICLTIGCKTELSIPVEITYIAQSGVFIESGSIKVLIDAVFEGDPRWDYPSPSIGLLDSMQNAVPPFDNIDLFLITHAHIDHFGAKPLEKCLINNQNAKLVTTPQVKQLMSNWCNDFNQIKNQVIVPNIPYNSSIDTIINDIPIHITHLKHGNDKEWPAIVYSFLVDINGKKILHNGGSSGYFIDEYKEVRYDTMNIDVAILYHHFLSDTLSNGKTVIDSFIKPNSILLGHFDGYEPNFIDSLEHKLKADYSNLSVFKKSKQNWKYQ